MTIRIDYVRELKENSFTNVFVIDRSELDISDEVAFHKALKDSKIKF